MNSLHKAQAEAEPEAEQKVEMTDVVDADFWKVMTNNQQ